MMTEQCPYYNVCKSVMPGHFMCEKHEGDCLVSKMHDVITKPGCRGVE